MAVFATLLDPGSQNPQPVSHIVNGISVDYISKLHIVDITDSE